MKFPDDMAKNWLGKNGVDTFLQWLESSRGKMEPYPDKLISVEEWNDISQQSVALAILVIFSRTFFFDSCTFGIIQQQDPIKQIIVHNLKILHDAVGEDTNQIYLLTEWGFKGIIEECGNLYTKLYVDGGFQKMVAAKVAAKDSNPISQSCAGFTSIAVDLMWEKMRGKCQKLQGTCMGTCALHMGSDEWKDAWKRRDGDSDKEVMLLTEDTFGGNEGAQADTQMTPRCTGFKSIAMDLMRGECQKVQGTCMGTCALHMGSDEWEDARKRRDGDSDQEVMFLTDVTTGGNAGAQADTQILKAANKQHAWSVFLHRMRDKALTIRNRKYWIALQKNIIAYIGKRCDTSFTRSSNIEILVNAPNSSVDREGMQEVYLSFGRTLTEYLENEYGIFVVDKFVSKLKEQDCFLQDKLLKPLCQLTRDHLCVGNFQQELLQALQVSLFFSK